MPITKISGQEPRGKKWILPLTYAPKITGVIGGTIRQTIRTGRKYRVGDWVAFHGWAGTPYHSKWSFRTGYFLLHEVLDILLTPRGIQTIREDGGLGPLHSWGSTWVVDLARRDGIAPPTGLELARILMEKNRIPKDGVPGQIIRW